MEETPKDTAVATESPVMTASSEPKKSSGNKTLLIILVIFLFCCITSACGFGALVLFSDTDSTSTIDTITDIADDTQGVPSIKDVEDKYLAVDSYHFEGEIDWGDGDMHEISGEFVSPDTEHYLTIDTIGSIEEVKIGEVYYINYDEEGWEEVDEPFNAGVQRDELLWALDLIPNTVDPTETSDGYVFSYFDEVYEEDWELTVDKNTWLPKMLRLEYVSEDGYTVVEMINFNQYDDPDTSVEAPL